MPYELFSNKATKFAPPELTIRAGRIFLNAGAGDCFTKIGAQHVHILWDRKALKVAIKPAKTEDDNSFRLTIAKGRRGGTLSAESFLKHIGWTGKGSATVPALWNDMHQMLEATLPEVRIAS